MLNINNKDDIPKMMQYHRARDMINLIKYFPSLSPIRNLTIVKSIQDYLENYDFCKKLVGERNDTLISKPFMKSVERRGIDTDIISTFEEVKKLDSDGVYIEAVGKGFDGREVSKGLDVHEIFFIPWFDLYKCNIENFRDYRTYLISKEDYKISREKRISFLTSLNLPVEDISKYIPVEYTEIPNFIWLDVIKNLIKKTS